jgi:hypothetical protein
MGSRTKAGTTEAIFQILSAISAAKQTKQPITLGLLDLSKAYDRVWRKGVWAKLFQIGVQGKLLRSLHSTYSSARSTVRIGDHFSKEYKQDQGLRQGSVLSPLLFVLLFSDIVGSVTEGGLPAGSTMSPLTIKMQLFVDDTILITDTPDSLFKQVQQFNRGASAWGSVLNLKKTEIITNQSLKEHRWWLKENKMPTEPSNLTKYLGVWISIKNDTWNQHYDKVLQSARKTFFLLKCRGLRSECVSPMESVELVKSLVIPKLLFAAEVLTPSHAVIKKINKFIAYMAKMLIGLPMGSNDETAMWEANMEDFSVQLERAKLRFHRKMILSRTGRLKASYGPGNDTFDHNKEVAGKWFPGMTEKEISLTKKFRWKKMLTGEEERQRQALMKEQNPRFLSFNPIPGAKSLVLGLDSTLRRPLLIARHEAYTQCQCDCGFGSEASPSFHYLLRCRKDGVFASRCVMVSVLVKALPAWSLMSNEERHNEMMSAKGCKNDQSKKLVLEAVAGHLHRNVSADEQMHNY